MWFNTDSTDVIKELNSDSLNGLTSEEAKIRLQKNGENKLASKKKKTMVQLFLAQLNDAMIYILIAAAVISGIMGEISEDVYKRQLHERGKKLFNSPDEISLIKTSTFSNINFFILNSILLCLYYYKN